MLLLSPTGKDQLPGSVYCDRENGGVLVTGWEEEGGGGVMGEGEKWEREILCLFS